MTIKREVPRKTMKIAKREEIQFVNTLLQKTHKKNKTKRK